MWNEGGKTEFEMSSSNNAEGLKYTTKNFRHITLSPS
jgi:hypothetical protein